MFSGRAKPQAMVVGLLVVHATLLAYLAMRYSPTIDEVGHLSAGLYTWEFGRFDVYRVNPPLVRTLASLPVWLSEPRFDWSSYQQGHIARPEWSLGHDLMRANGETSLRYFTWARWMLIPVSLLGGIVCFRWAKELYGVSAGLTALTLWCFSPTVLAYGALITPDLSAAAFGVTASYAYWRWLRTPTAKWTLIAGMTLGFAELTKMTWVILFALWPLLWVVVECQRLKVEGRKEAAFDLRPSTFHQLLKLAAILVLGLYVLNVGYALDGTFTRLGEYRFVSRDLSGQEFADRATEVGGNRVVGTWGERIPVPLPRDYVVGLDVQRREFERGKWSFLRGEWKQGGWWWYYLYGAAIKEPLGTWCLLGLAMIAAWRVPASDVRWTDTLAVVLPALAVFVLVSSQTGFNRYVRYVLPAFPFVFVWASQTVQLVSAQRRPGLPTRPPETGRWWKVPVGGALVWSVASSLWVYPHSLTYFNEAVGGVAGGHEHLIDAQVDWGQSLYDLRDWLEDHPDAAPVHVMCGVYVPLELLGLKFDPVPREPQPGWFIISRHDRHHRSGDFAYFDRLEPVDSIAGSLDVYHVLIDDVIRLQHAEYVE